MSDEEPELNLIPQWLKKGSSSSPRHAQAPPPHPPARGNSNSNTSNQRGGERGGNERGGGGGERDGQPQQQRGRFQTFVQTEQQRRGPPTSAPQGSFEGGRFTMGGETG